MSRPNDLITHWLAVTGTEPVPANVTKPVVIPCKAPTGVPDPPTGMSQPHDPITHWLAVTDTEPVPANAIKPVVIPSNAPIGVPDPPTTISSVRC